MMRAVVGILLAALPVFGQDTAASSSWKEVLRISDRAVVGFGFSPDGKMLGLGGRDYGEVRSFPDGRVLKEFRQVDLVDEALFDPGGTILVTRSRAQDALIHDASSWDRLKFVVEQERAPGAAVKRSCPAAFSPGGQWLALANGAKGLRFWDLRELRAGRPAVYEVSLTELVTGPTERMILPHANAFAFTDRECW